MSESNESDKKQLNIYQRINAVMSKVEAITPDGEVKINGKKAYDYISHDAVSAAIKPLFVEYGVVVRPTIIDSVIDGNKLQLTIDVHFINMDKPEDTFSITTIGQGVDNSGKGPGIAMSYALKIAYQKVFLLNSADDSGGEQTPHDPVDLRASEVEEAQKAKRAAIEASANTYKAGIAGAETVKELRALKNQNDDWLSEAPTPTQDYFADLFKARITALESEEG